MYRLCRWCIVACIALCQLPFAGGVGAATFEEGATAFTRGDFPSALSIWRPLAERGDANAQFGMGVLYRNGKAVPGSDSEAAAWFQRAAQQGHAKAQGTLGVMFAKGIGFAQDLVIADMWFILAGKKGDLDAAKNQSVLERSMSGSQISLAKKLAGECDASKYVNCGSRLTAATASPPPATNSNKTAPVATGALPDAKGQRDLVYFVGDKIQLTSTFYFALDHAAKQRREKSRYPTQKLGFKLCIKAPTTVEKDELAQQYAADVARAALAKMEQRAKQTGYLAESYGDAKAIVDEFIAQEDTVVDVLRFYVATEERAVAVYDNGETPWHAWERDKVFCNAFVGTETEARRYVELSRQSSRGGKPLAIGNAESFPATDLRASANERLAKFGISADLYELGLSLGFLPLSDRRNLELLKIYRSNGVSNIAEYEASRQRAQKYGYSNGKFGDAVGSYLLDEAESKSSGRSLAEARTQREERIARKEKEQADQATKGKAKECQVLAARAAACPARIKEATEQCVKLGAMGSTVDTNACIFSYSGACANDVTEYARSSCQK